MPTDAENRTSLLAELMQAGVSQEAGPETSGRGTRSWSSPQNDHKNEHISLVICRFYVCGIVPSWTGSVDSTFVMCTFGSGFFSTATEGVIIPQEVNQGSEL